MIICFIGGIGSGKSLSMAKELVQRSNLGNTSYCNFPIVKKGVIPLVKDEILKEKEIMKNGKKKIGMGVNWDFWENKKNFNLCLDELHNICNSRRPSTNVPMINFLAQIRKLLGEDEDYNLYWSSQVLERVDLALRDLTHEVIYCEAWHQMCTGEEWRWVKKSVYNRMYKKMYPLRKMPTKILYKGKLIEKELPFTYIVQYHFIGSRCIEKFHSWEFQDLKTYYKRDGFLGNPYFKYYESFKLVKYGVDTYA